MPGYRKPFRVEVLTPEVTLFSGEVYGVKYPGADGMVGVLGYHSPLVTTISHGQLTLDTAEGETREYWVAGGFAQVRENLMTILAEECQALNQLDRDDAWEQLERANRMKTETDEQYQRRQHVLNVARDKFNLIQKYRKRKRDARKQSH